MITTTPLTGIVPLTSAPERGDVTLNDEQVSGAAKARALVLSGQATETSPVLFVRA